MYENRRSPSEEAHEELNPYVNKLANRLMDLACKAELSFDSTGWQLISEVLSYAASAEQRLSEQQERISQLEHVSISDELTGALNRRGLKRQLAQTLSDAARHKETGVFGYFDLNDFKSINDSLGHDAGDAALRHFTRLLKSRLRPSDSLARIAGDEFAIILPRCDVRRGHERLLTLQKVVNNTPMLWQNEDVAVTCSLGIADIKPGVDPASLIASADSNMYRDKAHFKASAE